MFERLGRWTVARPWTIVLAWLAVGLATTYCAPSWRTRSQDDDLRFLPARCASVRGLQLLEKAFPQDVFASRAVFVLERNDRPLDAADFDLVDRLVARLDALRQEQPDLPWQGVVSYRDPVIGRRFIAQDRHATLVQLALSSPYLAVQTRLAVDEAERTVRAELASRPDAPALFVTGPAGIGRDLIKAGGESLDQTTWATILLVGVVLLLVYRSPVLALVPLVTIGISCWVALNLLALVTLLPGVHVVNISQVFAVVILFGAGTDYCLFLISRYREELELGHVGGSAITRAMRAVGGALAASAGTVVCGLGMMGAAEFTKIRCAGPVIALALAVGLIASLTLTPALLKIAGWVAFWPGRVNLRLGDRRSEFWESLSRWVVARPAVAFAGTLALLVPFAVLGLGVKPSYSPIGDLSPHSNSIRGLEVIRHRFPAGETGPLTVLLAADQPWDSAAGRKVLNHLGDGFARLDNVAEVRGLTRPLGQPLAELNPTALRMPDWLRRGLDAVTKTTLARYAAEIPGDAAGRHVARLEVVFRSDPFGAASIRTLDEIELWLAKYLPPGVERIGLRQAVCYGVTVHTRDLEAVMERDRMRVNALVSAGVFLILLVLVRRPWVAAYLLATVLLSYLATLGMTAIFSAIGSGRPIGLVEWRVPFFLFTILIAVGEDYNILLMTRAMQERKRHGPIEGMRRGLAKTGGTISACGLIMAGTFATLMLAELGTLVQIGFALGVGVMMDTFLIRPLLVPSFFILVDRLQTDAGKVDRARTLPFRRPSYRSAA